MVKLRHCGDQWPELDIGSMDLWIYLETLQSIGASIPSEASGNGPAAPHVNTCPCLSGAEPEPRPLFEKSDELSPARSLEPQPHPAGPQRQLQRRRHRQPGQATACRPVHVRDRGRRRDGRRPARDGRRAGERGMGADALRGRRERDAGLDQRGEACERRGVLRPSSGGARGFICGAAARDDAADGGVHRRAAAVGVDQRAGLPAAWGRRLGHAGVGAQGDVGAVRTYDEFYIKYKEFCNKNEELCVKHEELCVNMMLFAGASADCRRGRPRRTSQR